jgi:ABC transport system ATP-binding/permease protein
MRIVLAEMRGEQKVETREFKQAVIRIGRDQLRSNLVFDRAQWPMVSRLHAELRYEAGRCFVTDQNSTHGTFVNGQRISATEIRRGSRIQFGQGGPVLSLESIEEEPAAPIEYPETLVDPEAEKAKLALHLQPAPTQVEAPVVIPKTFVDTPELHEQLQPQSEKQPAPAFAEKPSPAATPKPTPILICESGAPDQLGRQFLLKDERTLLGRDAAADVSIDAAAAVVSRRHAEIVRQNDGSFVIVDLNSFNGTLLNEQRITQNLTLRDGDRVQLGVGGPIFRFVDPSSTPLRAKGTTPIVSPVSDKPVAEPAGEHEAAMRTLVRRAPAEQQPLPQPGATGSYLLFRRQFDGKQKLSVGRGPDNDIQLDGLLISKHHASFINAPQGVLVEDAGSTNGVYVNGGRIKGARPVQIQDVVQIGSFVIKVDPAMGIAVFDTRSKTRIDAIAITEIVRNAHGPRKLLDEISLAIEPNEFVGVLGPSGAGKSLLVKALNGMRRTTGGRVLINELELYQHADSLKQSIGYVPQDDIIHGELTVYRTLYYVARLRLSRDVPANEIDQIISEVLEVTSLTDRRDLRVSQLSGGQRKRVSIAVELITKPSVIFLDEPTSGLDPATEERIMNLFRQIAESGRTIILTTHAMENVRLFDRVALLLRGKLIFYGTPAEALEFVGADNFIELYNKLEEPVESEVARLAPLPANATKPQKRDYEEQHEQIADAIAEHFRQRFMSTDLYRRYIYDPLSQLQQEAHPRAPVRRRPGLIDMLRQWTTLVRRYAVVLGSDKWNLLIIFGQAPIIGLLTYLVVGENDARDFPYFILALVSVWFGTSVAARELVKERPIFKRERMINLGLLPYVASKLFVLSFIVGLQAVLLFGTVKALHYAGMMYLPGVFFGLPQLLVMALTGIVGIALGLFVSAIVKTSEVATSLVPLILIPQILFAGLIAVPAGVSKVVGAAMPATWAFDELKRLSTLDTLREEGSNPGGPNQGRGLYNHIKDLNTQNINDARKQIDEYRKSTSKSVDDYTRKLKDQTRAAPPVNAPSPPTVGPPPPVPDAVEVSDNLRYYVSFMHPWGSRTVDPLILLGMLFGLVIATLVALKARDIA